MGFVRCNPGLAAATLATNALLVRSDDKTETAQAKMADQTTLAPAPTDPPTYPSTVPGR